MKATIYIPFANGDAVKGFRYDGEELTAKKYVKMEENEYYGHRDGVDHMVVSSLGNNMAFNNYEKRKINVKNQTYAFHNRSRFPNECYEHSNPHRHCTHFHMQTLTASD